MLDPVVRLRDMSAQAPPTIAGNVLFPSPATLPPATLPPLPVHVPRLTAVTAGRGIKGRLRSRSVTLQSSSLGSTHAGPLSLLKSRLSSAAAAMPELVLRTPSKPGAARLLESLLTLLLLAVLTDGQAVFDGACPDIEATSTFPLQDIVG